MAELLFPLTEDGTKLSEQMAVKPLMRDQIAMYKLIESDEEDPFRQDQQGRYNLKKTPGYTMVGKKVIYDPVARRSVTIINKFTTRTIKTPMGDIKSTRPESIKFMSDKPIIEVREDEPEKYAFLERANENIDNPFRRKGKAKYYRVDARKKLAKEVEKDGFEVAATQWVWKEATYTELKACAAYVNSVRTDLSIKIEYKEEEAQMGYEMIKRALFALAKTDPHTVIKGSTLISEQMRMQIMDAERLQIILFVDAKTSKSVTKANSWVHNDTDLPTICTLDVGVNKHDGLLEFLAKDAEGRKHYAKIIAMLKKFLTPKE